MCSKDNPRSILIMGAAGRDFHNFNVMYRDDPVVRARYEFAESGTPGLGSLIDGFPTQRGLI